MTYKSTATGVERSPTVETTRYSIGYNWPLVSVPRVDSFLLNSDVFSFNDFDMIDSIPRHLSFSESIPRGHKRKLVSDNSVVSKKWRSDVNVSQEMLMLTYNWPIVPYHTSEYDSYYETSGNDSYSSIVAVKLNFKTNKRKLLSCHSQPAFKKLKLSVTNINLQQSNLPMITYQPESITIRRGLLLSNCHALSTSTKGIIQSDKRKALNYDDSTNEAPSLKRFKLEVNTLDNITTDNNETISQYVANFVISGLVNAVCI